MKLKKKALSLLSLFIAVVIAALSVSILSSALPSNNDSDKVCFNALADFSFMQNPNGAWSYESAVGNEVDGYTFTNLNKGVEVWGDWNDKGVIYPVDDLVTSPDINSLSFYPGSHLKDLSLTFTAPYSGTIEIKMANGAAFAPTTTAGSKAARLIVRHNDTTIRKENFDGSNNHSGRVFEDTMLITVNVGDKLRFIVGRNLPLGVDVRMNPEINYTSFGKKTVFNAKDDFSFDENPNGAWSYETSSGDEATGYTFTKLNKGAGFWGNYENDGAIKLEADQVLSSDVNCVYFYPASHLKDAVLTFTAPYTGTINLKMASGAVFAPTTAAGTDAARLVLRHNDETIRIENLDASNSHADRIFTDTMAIDVKQGDTLRFMVRRNVVTNVDVRMNPEITYVNFEEDSNPPIKEEFNAYSDFKTVIDPTSPWKYLRRIVATGEYQQLSYGADAWGSAVIGLVLKADSDSVTGKGALLVHPGDGTEGVLAFTAPYSGTIEMSMKNGGVFSPNSGDDGSIFNMYVGDSLYMSEKVSSANNAEGNRIFDDTKNFTVEAGDVFYFTVGANNLLSGDSTLFNPYIKYTEITSTENELKFAVSDKISVSDATKEGFKISWPNARGGKGSYSYTVYVSEMPITAIPTEGGIKVGANRSYVFDNLELGHSYYVAVVVSDGESTAMLAADEAVIVTGGAFEFDAYKDYSEKTQNSVWSYQSAENGSLKGEELKWLDTLWGNATEGTLTRVDSDLVTGNPSLLIVPGSDKDILVVFTAPYSGTVDVSLNNGGIFVPLNGGGNNYDGINFALYHNNKKITSFDAVSCKYMHSPAVGDIYVGRLFTDKHTINVNAGDKLYFSLNKNTAIGNDDTYINPFVEYTSVTTGSDNLKFTDNRNIAASDVTDNSLTINWPKAVGGTGKYNYTLYIQKTPIEAIPTTGGIAMGEKLSYKITDLEAYSNYYAAVVVNDGLNTASLIRTAPLSTIGNSYKYIATKDFTTGIQPINTPWRYYRVEANKLDDLKLITWNEKDKMFGSFTQGGLLNTDSDLVTGKPALCLMPTASSDMVVAFIAPFTGKIDVRVENDGVFAPHNGNKEDGINFKLYLNKKVVYSKDKVHNYNSHADRCLGTPISMEVKAGDVLYFTVNANKSPDGDSTMLDPSITYTFVEKGSDSFKFLPGAVVEKSNATKDSFDLNWSTAFSPIGEDINYTVYLSENPFKGEPTGKPIYTGKGTSTKCESLKIGRTYYVYIKAKGSTGATAVMKNTSFTSYCPTYNAYEGFNIKNEPGIWNYARRSYDAERKDYVYTLLNYGENECFGDPAKGMVSCMDSEPVTGNPALSLHPGTAGISAALVFTAPYSGKINITIKNGGVFAPLNGKDQDYDGIRFSIKLDSEEIYAYDKVNANNNTLENRVCADVITIDIKYGQRLYFVVEANHNNAADSTFLNPEIEYLSITDGDGIARKDGFVEEKVVEEKNELAEKMFLSSFRENTYKQTNGKAIALPAEKTNILGLLPYIIVIGVLAIGSAVLIFFAVPKKKR